MFFADLDQPSWYCVRTQSRQEHVAASHLRRLEDVEIFCPRIRLKKCQRNGAAVVVTEAVFPGYLFARFPFAQRHRDVRYAHGISYIVRFGLRYPVVDETWIAELRGQFDEGMAKEVISPLKIGAEVRVTQGPFQGLTATVTRLRSGTERVSVLLEFLGRDIEAELPTDSVFAAADHPLTTHA